MHRANYWQKRPYFPILVFGLAVLTRLAAVGRYITPDELIWVYRSVRFSEAISSAAWSETLTTGHPGVTITWVGALAIALQQMVEPASQETYRWISQLAWLRPENMAAMRQLATFLTAGRLLLIVLHSLTLVAFYLLARRLFSGRLALAAAVLILFDPFLAGLSGLLHVDAAQTLLATVSLLALGLALRGNERQPVRWTMLSAVTAALALLTKSPAVMLLPFCLFFLTFAPLLIIQPWVARMGQSFRAAALWLGVYLLTLFALLPALWVSPAAVFTTIFSSSRQFVEDALRPTFYMGQTAIAHPASFYPVSIAFRLTPLVFVGLIFAAGFALLYVWRSVSLRKTAVSFQILRSLLTHPATILLLWSIGYIVGITLAEKKFDRYALPVFPALTLLALLGWFGVWERWKLAQRVPLVVLLAFLAVVNYLPVAAYPLMGYNALLGGPWVAQLVLPIGWGDSVSAGTRWLENHADTRDSSGIGGISQAFAPFFSGEPLLASAAFYPQAEYVVWSKLEEQMRLAQGREPPFDSAILLHTVRYGGLDQAWVYRQPNPADPAVVSTALPNPIRFDGRVLLTASGMAYVGDSFHALLGWRLVDDAENGRYTLRLTLADQTGLSWYETEFPLLNETDFYPADWPRPDAEVRTVIPIERGTPPGEYALIISLVDTNSGALLPIVDDGGTFVGTIAMVATDTLPANAVNSDPFPVLPNPLAVPLGESGLTLLGFDTLPDEVATGAPLFLTLYWRADDALQQDFALRVWLGDAPYDQPLSGHPTSRWRLGNHLLGRYLLRVPTGFDREEASVSIELLDESGAAVSDSRLTLGRVRIAQLDRLFTLPPIDQPLAYTLGEQMQLVGVDGLETAVSPGDTIGLTLYWQVLTPPPQLIASFVHVIRPDGGNLVQSDQWPGGLPAALYAPEQVIVDRHTLTIPNDAAPGAYPIAVGLYGTESGVRLIPVDASGATPPDGRIMLPIQIEVGE